MADKAEDSDMHLQHYLQASDELITVLDSKDTEMIKLEQMGNIFSSWNKTLDEVNLEIKSSIKALTEERETEHDRVEAASHVTSANLAELESQKIAAEQHKQEVSDRLQVLDSKLEDCQKEDDALQQKLLKIQEESSQELASLRYTLKLYTHISAIRWQYDTDPDDIKGYICNKSNVKPFQLNTKQNSRYFIANYLWDLID